MMGLLRKLNRCFIIEFPHFCWLADTNHWEGCIDNPYRSTNISSKNYLDFSKISSSFTQKSTISSIIRCMFFLHDETAENCWEKDIRFVNENNDKNLLLLFKLRDLAGFQQKPPKILAQFIKDQDAFLKAVSQWIELKESESYSSTVRLQLWVHGSEHSRGGYLRL